MRSDFSAVQFRYDGAKGVVSVHPDMPQNIHLCIRDSMKKFDSDHECFEVCKLSAPRPLFLNQQAILLLSYRQVPDASFLILQQQNHLALVRALLRNADAEKEILQKVPSWFLPSDIHYANLDYIHEPFFRQLLISSCLQSMRDLLQRTRIRIPPNEGRNMIGIVDEYNVLEPGQVYIQYTILNNNKNNNSETKVLDNCKVVITKNPCHHPGDIRTFTAVNHPRLKHLKDVIVFSQQGDRPAPHDISGSDLDGDEYLVVWHKDLVPYNTKNAEPYDYDAHTPSKKFTESVTRDHINKTILDIAEQDCLGRLSNLHLAFADKFGVDSNRKPAEDVSSTVELAGAISQEVDSGKTGYHPLKEDKIKELNNALGNERPDFMDNPNFDQYESKHILGKRFMSFRVFFHLFCLFN
jgi:RNA-dependent RNA polymerase